MECTRVGHPPCAMRGGQVIARKAERVTRYLVEYNDYEAVAMQAIGMLPPDASLPARLWLTESEIHEAIAILNAAGIVSTMPELPRPRDA